MLLESFKKGIIDFYKEGVKEIELQYKEEMKKYENKKSISLIKEDEENIEDGNSKKEEVDDNVEIGNIGISENLDPHKKNADFDANSICYEIENANVDLSHQVNDDKESKDKILKPQSSSFMIDSYIAVQQSFLEGDLLDYDKEQFVRSEVIGIGGSRGGLLFSTTDSEKKKRFKIKSGKVIKSKKRKLNFSGDFTKRRKIGYESLKIRNKTEENTKLIQLAVAEGIKNEFDVRKMNYLVENENKITMLKNQLEEIERKTNDYKKKQGELLEIQVQEIQRKNSHIKNLVKKIEEKNRIVSLREEENRKLLLTIQNIKREQILKKEKVFIKNDHSTERYLSISNKNIEKKEILKEIKGNDFKIQKTQFLKAKINTNLKNVLKENSQKFASDLNSQPSIKVPLTIKKPTINISQLSPLDLYKKSVDLGTDPSLLKSSSYGYNSFSNSDDFKTLHQKSINYHPKTYIPMFDNEGDFMNHNFPKGAFIENKSFLSQKPNHSEIRKFFGSQKEINVEEIFGSIKHVSNNSPNKFRRIK